MTEQTDRLNTALAGRYRVERHLGEGGMASVHLCEDLKHDRKVALKLLKPELAAVLGAERFVVEIKTTAGLQHPHILPLFDSGTADGFLFYVMPYIQGESLRDRLTRETQLGVDDSVRIAREVLDALHYAHEHGIVHRDVKPENILLHGGHAMVADFGIALAVSAAAGGRMTETGLSLGTPHYMSPEQATAEKEITPRSDVYSLGSVLYEMLTGQPPHVGGAAQQVIMKIITTPAEPVTVHRKSVPPHVAAAVAKSLEKLPADRFESAKAFAEALGNESFARAGGAGRHAGRPLGTGVSRARSVLLGALVVVALGAAYWAGRRAAAGSDSGAPTWTMLVPEGGKSWQVSGDGMAISPDGRTVALVEIGPPRRLVLRSLDSPGTRALPGTDRGSSPFWSPDGRSLGFLADQRLKVLDLATGTVNDRCPAAGAVGGAWGADDLILFARDSELVSLPASAAACTTSHVADLRALRRPVWPHFLRDGRHFVLGDISKTMLGEVGRDTLTLLAESVVARAAVVSGDWMTFWPPGADRLVAQRIDVGGKRLDGPRVPLPLGIGRPGGSPPVAGSPSGTLVLFLNADSTGANSIERFGIDGRVIDSAMNRPSGLVWDAARQSNDRRQMLSSGLVVVRQRRGEATLSELVPFAAGATRTQSHAVWGPGDSVVYFQRGPAPGVPESLLVVATRTGRVAPVPVAPAQSVHPARWISRLARLLYYNANGAGLLDVATGAWQQLVAEPGIASPALSPDGRLIAYEVTKGNAQGVDVRALPGPSLPTLVARDGHEPSWGERSGELILVSDSRDIVQYRLAPNGTVVAPSRVLVPRTTVFASQPSATNAHLYVADDGRELVVTLAGRRSPSLTVVQHFDALLGAAAKAP